MRAKNTVLHMSERSCMYYILHKRTMSVVFNTLIKLKLTHFSYDQLSLEALQIKKKNLSFSFFLFLKR